MLQQVVHVQDDWTVNT